VASRSFEQLRVYQLAEELADLIWEIAQRWGIVARDTVGKQIIRSADSIGANVAERYGRGSYQDNRRFVRIARGSLYETRHWLRRAFKRKLLTETEVNSLKVLIDNLGPQLNSYLKSIGRPDSRDE
jgi:four helix bundle protein